ncbi:MAG: CocE/NonD family hydrolase [Deltaproteobacteria bacterium]|nr:CocE/NonD family hydrolase [Deltaproteobacteria bacterium]
MPHGSRPEYRIKVEKNVPAKMRDGTTLYADVYRPDAEGRFPVILLRLPYGKHMAADFGDHEFFPARGYVVVIQDGRGRFDSEGTYYPLIDEPQDGYDTVEWAASLPYANGLVGTQGQSYLGATQYLLAPTRPPHLRCAFPVSAAADFHQSWVYHTGGAFSFGWQIPYAIFLARNTIDRLGLKEELWPKIRPDLLRGINFGNPLTPEAYKRLPLMYWADLLKDVAPYMREYLTHPEDGPYWWAVSVERQHRNINIPMYHVSSWYDIFLRDALVHFNGLRSRAMTPEARGGQRLLLGPWAHLFPYTTPTTGGTGDIDFGPNAFMDLHDIQLRWFDYWLKGLDNGMLEEPPVRLFVMGTNQWRDEYEWPLARTRYTPCYLRSRGKANSLHGDGTLSFEPPTEEPADHYRYDPADPVPTCGGNTLIIPVGVKDQREVEARHDVLVYTSDPLEKPLEVTGPIKVVLYVSSSAPDTDFTAKLVDVRPDGYAQNIADGIVRARYRESAMTPKLLTKGEVVELTIDLWATSQVFLPGHRLRIEISSSNFPRFDRNLNTGGDQATETRWEVAEQTVFHGRQFRSHILLPVIP